MESATLASTPAFDVGKRDERAVHFLGRRPVTASPRVAGTTKERPPASAVPKAGAAKERPPAEDGPVPEGLEYEVVDGKSVTISNYTGSAASIAIPARIQGLPVTAIGDTAFGGSGLRSISIPASVRAIGVGAFAGCSGLTSISIPSSITAIGVQAFYECSGLTSISIPSSVTAIGFEAFYECSSLSSVTLSRRTQVEEDTFPDTAKLNYRD